MTEIGAAAAGMDVKTNVAGGADGAPGALDFPTAYYILLRVVAEENQLMNVLAKAKSDKRVVEVKEAVDGGETLAQAEARVASGFGKKPPHDDKVPTL